MGFAFFVDVRLELLHSLLLNVEAQSSLVECTGWACVGEARRLHLKKTKIKRIYPSLEIDSFYGSDSVGSVQCFCGPIQPFAVLVRTIQVAEDAEGVPQECLLEL